MARIAIIQFPGSNCENESLRAIRSSGMEAVEFLWNENPEVLRSCDGYFIVGGFSYEDRSRSGIIASLDPVMQIIAEQSEKGKPVLGVCNGAQILVETGIVPGIKNNAVAMALAVNKRVADDKILGTGFYHAWVHIRCDVPPNSTAFTRTMKQGEMMRIPVAHGEGRFVIPEELLRELQEKHCTPFRYCDADGNISHEFPINPNGAAYNLAAVSNTAGNVMAIMPHPERTANTQLFDSMRDYIKEQKQVTFSPLAYQPPNITPLSYTKKQGSTEIITQLLITDNEAMTVQTTLGRLGIDCAVQKYTHWEIETTQSSDIEAIMKSEELYNPHKERAIPSDGLAKEEAVAYMLVRYKDDFAGQAKLQTLKNSGGLDNLSAIHKGVLWQITAPHGTIKTVTERILQTRILANQFSQDIFLYTPSL